MPERLQRGTEEVAAAGIEARPGCDVSLTRSCAVPGLEANLSMPFSVLSQGQSSPSEHLCDRNQ